MTPLIARAVALLQDHPHPEVQAVLARVRSGETGVPLRGAIIALTDRTNADDHRAIEALWGAVLAADGEDHNAERYVAREEERRLKCHPPSR